MPIPYIKVPDLPIGPLTLHPFGILVATGVLVGTALTTRRARRMGVDVHKLNSFITWMLVAGFIGGHVLDALFYHWEDVKKDPLLLVKLWEGLSSFGGFIGGATGIVLWKFIEKKRHGGLVFHKWPGRPILPYADLVLSVFPIGWVFGRGGCAVVHDHKGIKASAEMFGVVEFPVGREAEWEKLNKFDTVGFIKLFHGVDYRFDLGLLEWMFTVVIAACFLLTWRRRLATGTYVAVTCIVYAPVRFLMDYLRDRDPLSGDTRYAGLTPAQWSCIALLGFGLFMVWKVLDLKKRGVDPMDVYRVGDDAPEVKPAA